MKWESLNYRQQEKLRKEYDERHSDEKPPKPRFEAPEPAPRTAIPTAYSTDVYVRMDVRGNRANAQPGEASGSIRLVGSNEHIQVELPADAIPALIQQLQALHADITRYNELADTHLTALKEYDEAIEAYNRNRDKSLTAALKTGKYTAEIIETSADDIPF